MILVAGGTGTLGRRVVALLGARGLDLRILSRHGDQAADLDTLPVETVAADVRDRAAVERAMDGVDTVVSAIQGFGGPHAAGAPAVDRDGNLTLIDAAVAAGVRHFVLLSIAQAAPDHPIELFRMKHAAEVALQASGLSWTILRPTASMETWFQIVGRPLAETGRTRVFGRGQNPVNFVAADDVARFVDLAVVDPTMRSIVVDVAGPDDLTFDAFTAIVGEVAGVTGKVDHIPRIALRVMAAALGPIRPISAGQIRAAIVMDTRDMRADPGPRQRLAPSVPVTPFADVVRYQLDGGPAPG